MVTIKFAINLRCFLRYRRQQRLLDFMKLHSIALIVGFALTGCNATSTVSNPSNTEQTQYTKTTVQAKPAVAAQSTDVITLEQIMADPDWMGRQPTSWYWADNSESFFYQQKREGSVISDLYHQGINDEKAHVVTLDKIHKYADRRAVLNQSGTMEAYTFEGDIYLKTLATGEVKQLTRTSSIEANPKFLTDGRLAYQVSNSYFAIDLENNQVVELAKLKASKKPEKNEEPSTYIAKEQHKLIDYVAKMHRNAKERQARKQQLVQENHHVVDNSYYFGSGNKIAYSSLSPKGDKLIVSVAKAEAWNDKSDIMPNYISSDGKIKAQSVRRRVADNRQYSETLFLIDLKTGTQTELSYQQLPGYNDDVLAKVRAENYARDGKKYQENRLPRNIALIAGWNTISWNDAGDQVALMLEAWDNKDRWITTVDFESKRLITQHRLSDEAWINWSYNEFGWLSRSNSLYYLSEQSGYGQLYIKPLGGKERALTQGNYVVSNLTVAKDEQFIYYKANKKHPGIYEIYRVNVETGKSEALTDLNGMTDYALSPNEQRLLLEHSKVTMPPELYVQDIGSVNPQRLTFTVSEQFLSMPWVAPQVVAIPSSHTEQPIYSKVYLPKNYQNSAEKLRAVMFSHGAGYLQNAHLGWSGYFREFMFHSMLVQQGYAVIDMDYRASKGYGRDWRTAIYRHMGKPEVQDMRDGVNWLVENANVDRNRIGTYGGSYGGFLTLMSMFTEPDLFQSGSALRLVSDWAYYNHGYTSNILNTPEDDPIAYERSSPIYFAEGLQKPLLINAPMVDDNVFFQDTVRLVQRLIELEKQDFETAIFPVEPHGFRQPSSWLDEYRRIFKLFEQTL